MTAFGDHWSSGRKPRAARVGVTGALAVLMLLSACGIPISSADRVRFDNKLFRTQAKPVDKKKAPTEFTVVVHGASASVDGAREAGRYEGIKYCIEKFGSSRIDWKVGPDTEPQNLRIADDKLLFAGSCQRP